MLTETSVGLGIAATLAKGAFTLRRRWRERRTLWVDPWFIERDEQLRRLCDAGQECRWSEETLVRMMTRDGWSLATIEDEQKRALWLKSKAENGQVCALLMRKAPERPPVPAQRPRRSSYWLDDVERPWIRFSEPYW